MAVLRFFSKMCVSVRGQLTYQDDGIWGGNMKQISLVTKFVGMTLSLALLMAVPAIAGTQGSMQGEPSMNFQALSGMAADEQLSTGLSDEQLDSVQGAGIYTTTAAFLLLANAIANTPGAPPAFGLPGGLANLVGTFALVHAFQTPFSPCGWWLGGVTC
jgi:hypothetical protein